MKDGKLKEVLEIDKSTSDVELDEAVDEIADKLANSATKKLVIWFIRTTIGLSLFGYLWYSYDWGIWVFWSYVVIAGISLFSIIYFHLSLVKAFNKL